MNEIKLDEKKPKVPRLPRKRNKLVFVVVVVVVLVVGGVIAYWLWPSPGEEEVGVCKSELLSRASPLISESNGPELLTLSDEIYALPEYQTDVNCMYIVTQAQISVGDAEKARAGLTQLEKVFDPEVGYSDIFGSNAQLPYQLVPIVEFLESQQDLAPTQDNGFFFGDQTR